MAARPVGPAAGCTRSPWSPSSPPLRLAPTGGERCDARHVRKVSVHRHRVNNTPPWFLATHPPALTVGGRPAPAGTASSVAGPAVMRSRRVLALHPEVADVDDLVR